MPGKLKHLCGSIGLSICRRHEQGMGVSGQWQQAVELAPLLLCPLPACILYRRTIIRAGRQVCINTFIREVGYKHIKLAVRTCTARLPSATCAGRASGAAASSARPAASMATPPWRSAAAARPRRCSRCRCSRCSDSRSADSTSAALRSWCGALAACFADSTPWSGLSPLRMLCNTMQANHAATQPEHSYHTCTACFHFHHQPWRSHVVGMHT